MQTSVGGARSSELSTQETLSRDEQFAIELRAHRDYISKLTDELALAYGLANKAQANFIEATRQLDEARLQLGPLQFADAHSRKLRSEHRLIELDFAAEPKSRNWSKSPHIRKLVARFKSEEPAYIALMRSFLKFSQDFRRIPVHAPVDLPPESPRWDNGWLPGLDGIVLYALVAAYKPRTYFEVGSGNSTKFVRQAIRNHGLSTRIVSIDPFPRAEVDLICDEIHRVRCEDIELSLLSQLQADDVVFIDNSHRSFPNSDVTVFFMEILGRLPPGVVYGLHDIFLPYDYPAGWMPRYYNEQYLMASYLFGGAENDTIILPCGYVSHEPSLVSVLDPLWTAPELQGVTPYGGGFWMRKSGLIRRDGPRSASLKGLGESASSLGHDLALGRASY